MSGSKSPRKSKGRKQNNAVVEGGLSTAYSTALSVSEKLWDNAPSTPRGWFNNDEVETEPMQQLRAETRREIEALKIAYRDDLEMHQRENKSLRKICSDAMDQMSDQEKSKMLITEEADKKAQAAEALAKEAENLQGQARADAALKAREAAEIAEEAADRRRAAETEVLNAQAQRQQRERTIEALEERCRVAEATLEAREAGWKEERENLKEGYKQEVEKVRERLWENRTLETLVKQLQDKCTTAEKENERLAKELSLDSAVSPDVQARLDQRIEGSLSPLKGSPSVSKKSGQNLL